MKSQQRGFTLWELLMTLLVAGILLGLGVPNVMEFQRSGVVTGAANDLVTGLLQARTEAVKRQVPVTFCLSNDPLADPPACVREAVANSTRGFIIWADENGDLDALGNPDLSDTTDGDAIVGGGETVLFRGAALDPNATLRLSATCGHVVFGPNGWVQQVAGQCGTSYAVGSTQQAFLFCDDRGNSLRAGRLSAARAIRVEGTGRGVMLQEQSQITPLVGFTGATCP
jgi:type IV fimbrial biogenesis protein FimT